MSIRESLYQRKYLRQVLHTTLNPYGPGVVRIHMIPPKFSFFRIRPYVVLLNGQDVLPINLSWAILLSCFIRVLNQCNENELTDDELQKVVDEAIYETKDVYPEAKYNEIKEDLSVIIDTLCDVAYGKTPETEIGYMSLAEYAPYMTAPHRMDLCISAMTKDGAWHCNQNCLHCYAAGQPKSESTEISTKEWLSIIDECRKIGIPQLTFTGGEPTLRPDLFELIHHARWFVTRLNTNGILLTEDFCSKLYEAELDSVQITFYSVQENIHNHLVGSKHYQDTVNGIKNALSAHLNISINTPLCTLNADYLNTLQFLHELGIQYVTCSGLILTGNATNENSKETTLSHDALLSILKDAVQYCNENHMEISFTSPGLIASADLAALGLSVPSCGACLSNMAIAPDGTVLPCQSWLSKEAGLGNLLTDSFHTIWNSRKCSSIRKFSSKQEDICPFRQLGGNIL